MEEMIKGEWHFIAKRYGAPPLPVWYKFPPLSEPGAKKIYSTIIPWLAVWEEKSASFYIRSQEYKKSIKTVTDLLFDVSKTKKHVAKVLSLCSLARVEAGKFYKKDLASATEGALFAHYQKIVKAYSLAFARGYITWCAQIFQNHALELLRQKKIYLQPFNLDETSAFDILAISPHKTMYNKKERALDALAKQYELELKKFSKFDQKNVSLKLPAMHKGIASFLKKYGWVGYDYGGPAISYEEVITTIRDRKPHLSQNQLTKAQIHEVCKFTSAEKSIYEVFSLLAYIKDVRNITDDYIHFCLDNFFIEIGTRHNMTKEDVRYLWPKELKQLIKDGKEFSPSYLKEKFECAVALVDNTGEHFWVGTEAKLLATTLHRKEHNGKEEKATLKGTSASPGRVCGVVKVVGSFNELVKVHKGDILVTSMTSPRFMAGIIKAGAIITDEGGLTCHAAIIARELRKPCIVGTKTATKVLKDGNMVEVDAVNGTVKILS